MCLKNMPQLIPSITNYGPLEFWLETKSPIYPLPWIPLSLLFFLRVPEAISACQKMGQAVGHWPVKAQLGILCPKQELGQSLPGAVCEAAPFPRGLVFKDRLPHSKAWRRTPDQGSLDYSYFNLCCFPVMRQSRCYLVCYSLSKKRYKNMEKG